MKADEKRKASHAFKFGEDNLLVATETYECGMHNENCSKVVRTGCARNTAVVVQELGRVGRDEATGEFCYMWNQFNDDQHLARWLKSSNSWDAPINKADQEVKTIIESFIASWLFVYSHLVGMCSHEALSALFDDPADNAKEIGFLQVDECMCRSCNSNYSLVDATHMITTIPMALRDVLEVEEKITMQYFGCFLMQSSIQWLRERPDLVKLESFGCAAEWPNVSMEGLLNLILICICFGYIELDYDFFSLPDGACRCYHRLYLSDLGTEYCNEPKQIELPDPLCNEVSKLTKSGGKQKCRSLSQVGVPNVKKLLKDSSTWLTLTDKKQYRALGFGLEEFPFLYYVKNWKEVKGV